MPGWRNGRRTGLKILNPSGCVGSNPTPGRFFKVWAISSVPATKLGGSVQRARRDLWTGPPRSLAEVRSLGAISSVG